MPAVSASQTQYAVSPTWTAVDFGLNSALDTDSETVTTDPAYASYYSGGGTGRPPEQRASIVNAWSQRQTSPSTIGQGAEDWINLMNQVGISVGDIAVAVGITPTEVRSYLLSNTFWTPLETSSKDIEWAELRGSPVGPFEIFVGGGGYFLTSANSVYVRFYSAAPYTFKSYTATWTLSRFTNQLKYVGSVKTITLDKTYNLASFSSLGGYLKSGNVVFAESMWNIPPGGETVGVLPTVVRGPGDTDYLYKWSIVGSSLKQFVGSGTDSSAAFNGFVPPIPTFQYQLWSADGDFAIGSVRDSNTTYIPSGFTVGGGGGGGSGPLAATVAIASQTATRSVATSFTPVVASGGFSPYVYSITPFLPSGLNLNQSTGTISGTATATSPATIYTVTITDSDLGIVTGNFTLTVAEQTNVNPNDLASITSTLSSITNTLSSLTTALSQTATQSGISTLSTSITEIKTLLNNMPDYTEYLSRLATALETIAENSTTDTTSLETVATKLGTISLDGANIKVDIGDIDASLATVASKMTEIEKYQKKLKELGEGPGIHMIGPYEWFNLISIYRLLLEQGKILDDSENASPERIKDALAKVSTYISKIGKLPTSFEVDPTPKIAYFNAETGVNSQTNQIKTNGAHGFTSGDEIKYSSGGDPVLVGLSNDRNYFVTVINEFTLQLMSNGMTTVRIAPSKGTNHSLTKVN